MIYDTQKQPKINQFAEYSGAYQNVVFADNYVFCKSASSSPSLLLKISSPSSSSSNSTISFDFKLLHHHMVRLEKKQGFTSLKHFLLLSIHQDLKILLQSVCLHFLSLSIKSYKILTSIGLKKLFLGLFTQHISSSPGSKLRHNSRSAQPPLPHLAGFYYTALHSLYLEI